jgi:uncharacterized lipoprotein YmbA
MMPTRPGLWLPLMLACCGCASAPVSYYTLIPPPASSNTEAESTCCIIEIRNVRIPPQVDRAELVIRRSDEQFDLLSNDLWIAPLRDEVRGALLNDIHDKLPQRRSGDGERARKFVVFIDVSRFESEPAKYALIEAEWRVARADEPKSIAPVCKTLAQVPVTGGVSGLVQGYQQALSIVASSITVKLLDAQQGGALECPTPQPAG